MRVNIFSCLFVFVLGCNVTAEISHQVLEEKKPVTLHCPQSVEGKVTWSRERNGHKVDLLTTDGDRDIRHNDSLKRFSSLGDKSFHIGRVNVSDTGRYFCNEQPAVDLTVIPSGTKRLNVPERALVNLTCPPDVGGSDVPSWSRDGGEIDERRVSRENKMLTIRELQPDDSGLYYCDGKAAVYLNVSKDQTSERGTKAPPPPPPPATPTPPPPPPPPPPATTTTTTTTTTTPTTTTMPTSTTTMAPTTTTTPTTKKPRKNKNKKNPPLGLLLGITVPLLLLLLLLIIIIITVTLRRRFKRQGTEEGRNIYDEIQDGSGIQPTNARPNLEDNTYSTICNIPLVEKRSGTHLPNESPYSVIDDTFIGGNNKGPSQPSDSSVYFLLQKPKTPENNNEQQQL